MIPVSTAPLPPLRLRTLGTLALSGASGEPVLVEQGQHGLRLALLAVLAVAGERGRTRDQLLGLFWPESTQSRARHSLTQLLYAMRTSLHESIIDGTNPIRLNPAVIVTDVAEFEGRAASGDLPGAVHCYDGPFLDGFHLGGEPEFEQWLDAERARWHARFMEILERLASEGEAAGQPDKWVKWARRLTEQDALSGKYASGLVRALAAAGDHVAAIKSAERYESQLRTELGTGPGAEFMQLVAGIRSRSAPGASPRVPLPDEFRPREASGPTGGVPGVEPGAPSVTVPVNGADARKQARPGPVSGRAGLLLAVAFGVLAIAATFAITRDARGTARPIDRQPSLAILPLRNLSSDPVDAPLADAMTEELISVLSRVNALRVIAGTSVFVFRNSDTDVRRIADSLGVTHILEGGFQKSAPRVRVQVRLVDGRDGTTMWSSTFDREMADLLDVQSEIARAVANELDLQLVEGSTLHRSGTTNLAAYELYLRGRDPVILRSESALVAAVGTMEQAIALDSNFAAAHATLTYPLRLLAPTGILGPPHEVAARARRAAERAVSLDDSLPEAHAASGIVHALGMRDVRAAEQQFQRALQLPGWSRARQHLVQVLLWTGRYEQALAEARRDLRDDPLSAIARAEVGQALCITGEVDAGLAELQPLSQLRPPLRRANSHIGICHALRQDWPASVAAFRDSRGLRTTPLLIYALARQGERAEAESLLVVLEADWRRTGLGARNVAMAMAGLGRIDEAFEWIERAILDLSLDGDLFLPLYSDLHRDPRFAALRRRLGLPGS